MRSMAIGRGAGAAQAANANTNANAAAKVKQRAKPRFKSRLSSGSIYGFAERLALRCSQKAVRRIGKPADEAHLISDQTALSAPGSIDAAVFTAILHRWAHLETPAWRGFADGTPPPSGQKPAFASARIQEQESECLLAHNCAKSVALIA